MSDTTRQPITTGRDHNFFQKVSVSQGGTAFATNADIIITFTSQEVMFVNLGTGTVEYSFNGFNVHGELNSANVTANLTFENRVIAKIWFRVQTGSSGPITVSVQAWGS